MSKQEEQKPLHGASISSALLSTSISSAVAVLFSFVSGVLLARVLGPATRGEYGTIILIGQTVAGFAALSFFDAALLTARREGMRLARMMMTLIMSALAIGVFSSIIAAFVVPFLDLPITEISLELSIVFIALMIFTNLFSVMFSAADRSEMQFSGSNFARVSSAAIFALVVALAWLAIDDEIGLSLILIFFISAKIPSLVLWAYNYRVDFRGSFSFSFAKDALTTGVRLHLAIALTLIAGPLDRFFAAGNWSQDLLGNYFVAFSAVGVGYGVITSALATVFFPFFSNIVQAERPEKISQTLRFTFIFICLILTVGVVVLPFLVPFVYGAAYTQAAGMSVGLLFALAPQPLRIIILEASRSLGLGRPAVHMAISSIAVMFIGYGLTRYSTPTSIILAFGLSNIVSTLVGGYHLMRVGDLKVDTNLIPRVSDLALLRSMTVRIFRSKQ